MHSQIISVREIIGSRYNTREASNILMIIARPFEHAHARTHTNYTCSMHDAPPSDKPVHLLNDVQQLKVIPCRYTSAATCGGGRCRHEVCLDTCKKKKASWPIPNPPPPLHQLAQRRRDAADQRCLFSLLHTSLSCCDKLNIHDESFRPRGEELVISVIMESRALSPRDGGWGERGGKTSGLAGAYSVGGGGGSGVEKKKL